MRLRMYVLEAHEDGSELGCGPRWRFQIYQLDVFMARYSTITIESLSLLSECLQVGAHPRVRQARKCPSEAREPEARECSDDRRRRAVETFLKLRERVVGVVGARVACTDIG